MLSSRTPSIGLARTYLMRTTGTLASVSAITQPEPRTGKHAAAAAKARDDLIELHVEMSAARYAITSAREAGKP